MDKKKKKKLIIAVSVVLVLAIGGTVIRFTALGKSKSTSTTTFRKVTAQTGSISTSVSGSGSVSDSSQITLSAANAGTIDNLTVKQGDTVKAGQVIAHVDSTASTQTVQQKQAALTSAQNDLSQAKEQLDGLKIKSPVAGKVKSITASNGDSLATIKPLGNLAVISTSRSMTISFDSSQQVKPGQTVTVTASGKSYSGTISSGSSGGSQGGQSGQGSGYSGSTTAVINSDDPAVGDTAVIALNGTTIGTGKLQLESSVPISNSGTGTIAQVYVSANQMVSKNQSLFLLSSDSIQGQISSKENAVTAAQQALTDAQASASQNDITSPIDGIVAELNVKKGDSVTSGGTIAVVVDPNALQTVVSVDELDISKVKVGQKATISLEAITEKTFTGEVIQVDPIGTASNGVATYNVTVSIDNPENIKVGMTTNVSITTENKDNVVVVSANAILMKNGSKGYVLPAANLFDSNGKSIKLDNITTAELIQKYGKQVTIGMATQDKDEITGGISDGDNLAVPVTMNPDAIKSLSNQSNSNNNSFGFGGMSGRSGMGNFGGTGGYTRKSGGSGNTVGANNGTNGSTNNNTNNNANGTNNTGNAAKSGYAGQAGNNKTAGNN